MLEAFVLYTVVGVAVFIRALLAALKMEERLSRENPHIALLCAAGIGVFWLPLYILGWALRARQWGKEK
jgi:hypothetical protein